MRQLRFVRLAEDGDHLVVEAPDGSDQFILPIDPAVRDATRSDVSRPRPPAPEPEATISPREIQVRVRAGESPDVLAEEHGVTLERVLRFAGPVLEERKRIGEEAWRARARRGTTDGQVVQFGETVDGRFLVHGIFPSTITWDAHRREDGEWVITASWSGGQDRHCAEWIFHRTTRFVSPVDDTAADLLSDRPIRPFVPTPAHGPDEHPTAATPLMAGVVAFPPMPDAHTGPIPVVEDVFDQDANGTTSTAARAGGQFDAPTLPLTHPALTRVTNLGLTRRDQDAERQRAARPRVPSWDDILLGVRRKQD